MKKINLTLGIFVATLLLTLSLQPAAAQASEIIAQTNSDAISAFFTITLTPIWIVIGKATKKTLGE